MRLYRVRNWAELYETHETRKIKALHWLPVPNKHDGLGYRRVMAQSDAGNLFAAWNLIIQVASRGLPECRGTLERDGFPLDSEDLETMTGFPAKHFTRAFAFFVEPKQGWLDYAEIHEENQQPPGGPGDDTGATGYHPVNLPGAPVRREGPEGPEGPDQKEERRALAGSPGRRGCAIPLEGDWPSVGALVAAYNAESPDECPAVEKISPGRIKKIREYLGMFADRGFWQVAFHEMHRSPFLRGKGASNGHAPFLADLDWLLTKGKDGTENVVKVHDGKYLR